MVEKAGYVQPGEEKIKGGQLSEGKSQKEGESCFLLLQRKRFQSMSRNFIETDFSNWSGLVGSGMNYLKPQTKLRDNQSNSLSLWVLDFNP